MATYDVNFYGADPRSLIPTGTGNTFVWSGPASPVGSATITDNESGIEGVTLDDDSAGGESARADVTFGGNTSTSSRVDAEEVWTLRDTVTGETFQVIRFDVEQGDARGDYTLSEMNFVAGRTYEVVDYDTNPDASAGDAAFNFDDYADAQAGVPLTDHEVDGTSGDDVIDASYTGDPDGDQVDDGGGLGPSGFGDVIDGHDGDDTISGGAGADYIYGGEGQDTIDGGDGDDTIYGDGNGAVSTSETLSWISEGNDGTDLSGGFTQNTGTMNVSVSFVEGPNSSSITSTDASQYVEGGETFDANSGLELFGSGGVDETSRVHIDFQGTAGSGLADAAQNITFRLQDIDNGSWHDQLTINAYDADGNLLDPAGITLTNDGSDTVSGNQVTASGGGDSSTDQSGSTLVTVAGPAARVEIIYENLGSGGQMVIVSDVEFDTVPVQGDADTIDGGAGDDTIYAGAGSDILSGGTGADVIFGEAGDDSFTVAEGDAVTGGDGDDTFTLTDLGEAGSADITIVGGEGDETLGDTLDFQGLIGFKDITYTNTDDTSGGLSGYASLADGSTVNFSEIENVIICFAAGTRILTPHGALPVENLVPGDLVITADNGIQPVRWIGKRTVPAAGNLAPICIRENTLGNMRELCVSPQHRILFTGYRAELLFGQNEVLVPAKHLVDDIAITERPGGDVTYVHLMFDQHEIIFAEGTATESFHPGMSGLDGVTAPAREELFTLFPELRSDLNHYGPTSRLCLKRHEARALRLDFAGDSAP